MIVTYAEFLARKATRVAEHGRRVDLAEVHTGLHEWQARIVQWAVRVGRVAVWADTGLGKTCIQLEWARLVGGRALVVAPLAVCAQTVREAARIGIDAAYVRGPGQITGPGVWVTNYDIADRFDPDVLSAVVLDESSILKDVTSKTRDMLITLFARVPYRLACSATPAPNDVAELANHAEFLGHASRREMLSTYFVHDADGWRPKGHARMPMFEWMAGWAVALRRPSDLGYPDGGYALPPLEVRPHLIPVAIDVEGQLFATDLGGVGGRARVRRETLDARCGRAAGLVAAEPDEAWLLWCGLNGEADRLAELIPGAVNVHGAMSPQRKADLLLAFADGRIRHLVTKPGIAAWGLNWQHCARMVFVGLGDSYEAYYQAIRRCWRYGQTRPVQVHIVLSELEAAIADNVRRKEQHAARIDRRPGHGDARRRMVAGGGMTDPHTYLTDDAHGASWTLMLGDACERLAEIPDRTVDLSVCSPPFAQLYNYSPSVRDLSNSRSRGEFFDHYRYVIREQLRVTRPGRVAAVHVADITLQKVPRRDGPHPVRRHRLRAVRRGAARPASHRRGAQTRLLAHRRGQPAPARRGAGHPHLVRDHGGAVGATERQDGPVHTVPFRHGTAQGIAPQRQAGVRQHHRVPAANQA